MHVGEKHQDFAVVPVYPNLFASFSLCWVLFTILQTMLYNLNQGRGKVLG